MGGWEEHEVYNSASWFLGSISIQLAASMNLNPQSVCRLAFLSLCYLLMTVRKSDSSYVPGRCMCPQTQAGVRGQLKDLTVFLKNPQCDNITVIVTLADNTQVCLNPEAPMGKQLLRCWSRVQRTGGNMKLCLKRRKRRMGRRQRPQRRRSAHNQKAPSSNSQ